MTGKWLVLDKKDILDNKVFLIYPYLKQIKKKPHIYKFFLVIRITYFVRSDVYFMHFHFSSQRFNSSKSEALEIS